uniref:Uncharacterized protein n=1 Tax=Arundo donax TaxID=35708 RepID=A0A0A9AWL8_ARUDO
MNPSFCKSTLSSFLFIRCTRIRNSNFAT